MKTLRPKQIDQEFNVDKSHPLAELGWMLGGILLILAVIYYSSGLMIDYVVDRVTPETEEWLWEQLDFSDDDSPLALTSQEKKLQTLLDDLSKHSAYGYNYKIMILDDEELNAFAAPGGRIMVTKGLLDEIKTENGLAMVLGHEIGHFANRDHLRGMGRGLVLTLLLGIVFGDQDAVGSLVGGVGYSLNNKYSRDQERAADAVGLDTLNKHYGHVAGAEEFFELILKEHGEVGIEGYISTHPLSSERIENIKKISDERDYQIRDAKKKSW